ncbi:hypothetical protein KI387_035121 [Taxus chinensis]|uniref:Uncharacterized protein n=1 Tax=Taxus chinensis TaxID=29808 RepID=A0AA38FMX3_TAXCH|nr:hypothetical protein KI387_035121 [Taxus chinensis]
MDDTEGLVKRIVHTSLEVEKPVVAYNVDSPEIMNGRERKAEWVEKNGQSIGEVNIEVVPAWKEQLTFRGLVASFLIGTLFSIIVMNLNLTTGLAPTMNVSAGLLAFVLMRTWTKLLEKVGFLNTPFTKQENTVIQTCVVACYSIAYGGGFGSYLLGMNSKTYKQAGISSVGNSPDTVKEPGIGWMSGFLFLVTFVGILVLVPLRKVLIVDYKLTYPSGTATAVLINGFHTPHKDKMARKQIRCFGKCFTVSFLWGFFKWFFGAGDGCGFANFPTFGLRAWKQRFYFDFSLTYVGAGMICPHLVNVSMLLGGILSWGIMWPLISKREGDWYPNNLPESSIKGLNGYKVFVCVALILGDGLYNFVKILWITGNNFYMEWRKRVNAQNGIHEIDGGTITKEEERQNELFVNDTIPMWIAASGYVALAAVSVAVIPQMFNHMKWYYVLVAYLFAPVLAFCNAYGTGLTDQNLAYNYGKVALFVFAAWAGEEHGGVLVSLALCGTVKSLVQTAADLMHDFKTGHLTLSSPRSMFVSQLIGNSMGCIIAPLTFWLFYQAFDVGNPEGQYKAPFALIYRNMAVLGVEGFSALPSNCLDICFGAFAFAVMINALRDVSPERVSQYIPMPMAMAIPFYVGPYFAIDMCLGTAIVFAWQKLDRKKADDFIPVMASGFICGEGIWIVPSAILALTKVAPPICMKFLSRPVNQRVDNFLRSP